MALSELSSQRAQNASSGTTVSSRTCAYPANVTAGDLLIIGVTTYNSAGAPASIAVTDTRGTTYSVFSAVFDTGAGSTQRLALAYGVAPSSGANTVTVDPAGDAWVSMVLGAFTGQHSTPLDVDGGESHDQTLTAADSLTTLAANALLI